MGRAQAETACIDRIRFAVYPGFMSKHAQASHFAPGDWVRHPERPDWGLGRIQSAPGTRLTETFENAGKQALNAETVSLVRIEAPDQGE